LRECKRAAFEYIDYHERGAAENDHDGDELRTLFREWNRALSALNAARKGGG